MPLSAIQTLPPKVPNSLTALLQGSGQALTGALTNAVQLGRDAVNNQVQQERSLLTERRSEINLAQRRGENEQKQFNVDRAFGENQRQFGELDRDRDLDRGIRETESKGRNALNAQKLLGVKRENDFAASPEGVELQKIRRATEFLSAQTDAKIKQHTADTFDTKSALATKALDYKNKKLDADIAKLGNKLSEDQLIVTETLRNNRSNVDRLRARGEHEAADTLQIEVDKQEEELAVTLRDHPDLFKSIIDVTRIDEGKGATAKQVGDVAASAAQDAEIRTLANLPMSAFKESLAKVRTAVQVKYDKRDPKVRFESMEGLGEAAVQSRGDAKEFKALVVQLAKKNGMTISITDGQAAALLRHEYALVEKAKKAEQSSAYRENGANSLGSLTADIEKR